MTYSGAVYRTHLNGNNRHDYPVIGDVYRYLTIDFSSPFAPDTSGAPAMLIFRADTDKAIVPVPEPTTLLLFFYRLGRLGRHGPAPILNVEFPLSPLPGQDRHGPAPLCLPVPQSPPSRPGRPGRPHVRKHVRSFF